MKKAVVILASPRKNGNSATLVGRVMKGIRDAGGACESICLNGLTIRPCQACGFCQRKEGNGCASGTVWIPSIKRWKKPIYS